MSLNVSPRQENDELLGLTGALKDQVYRLQQELQWHVNNGCNLHTGAKDLITQVQAAKWILHIF